MCMFTVAPRRVARTRIAVFDNGVKQTTVYANRVTLGRRVRYTADADPMLTRPTRPWTEDELAAMERRGGGGGAIAVKPTAMVLPVPVLRATRATDPEGCGIEVHDMRRAQGIFDALEAQFEAPRLSYGRAALASNESFGTDGAPPLRVLRSGAYRYSIVPTLDDFARLQHETYDLDPASPLATVLRRHYADGFAFLVCVIDADAEYAPFAYTHDAPPCGALFVPGRHYHGEHHHPAAAAHRSGAGAASGGGASGGTSSYRARNKHWRRGGASTRSGARDASDSDSDDSDDDDDGADASSSDDWDHEIYFVGCAEIAAIAGDAAASAGADASVDLARAFRSADVALPFMFPRMVAAQLLRKRTIRGAHPNVDLWALAASRLTRGGACSIEVTGEVHAPQPWYVCATCQASGAFGANDGACASCAARCHAGHAVTLAGVMRAFCDCAAHRGCLCRVPERDGVGLAPAACAVPPTRAAMLGGGVEAAAASDAGTARAAAGSRLFSGAAAAAAGGGGSFAVLSSVAR